MAVTDAVDVSSRDTYDLEKVRKEWIGKSTELVKGRYPVEYDPIRRHCHMVDDRSALFLDPEYARATRFGEVIAPPVMVEYFATNGYWPTTDEGKKLSQLVPTRGPRRINLTQTMEFYKPVRVGDWLSWQMVITDIKEKAIRIDPKAIWITSELRIFNQHGELVSVIRGTGLAHRSPAEVAADTEEGA